MDNRILFFAAGVLIAYFYCKGKTKQEVKKKVDNAVNTVTKEIHEDFNKAIDAAKQKELSYDEFKAIINS